MLILGAGASGNAAAAFLSARGADVTLHDDTTAEFPLSKGGGANAPGFFLAVLSPGIPLSHPIVRELTAQNIPIMSELELGFTARHRKIVAITGTNGKTTVTRMLGAALGNRGIVCGNIGTPVTEIAHRLRNKIAVAEVSSFQLEHTQTFHPKIAVILNITQDHLERHGTMEEYTRCKAKIFGNQTARDILILNYDDARCRELAAASKSRILWFSQTARVRGVYVEGKHIIWNISGRARKIFRLDDFGEEKPHGIQNILAYVLAGRLLRVSKSALIAAARQTENRHRLQFVASHKKPDGAVMFYNDSKATNIASTLAACRCFQSPVNLLLGGMSKGQNFAELFEKLPKVVSNIFVFGNSAEQIITAAGQANFKPIRKCTDLRDAVIRAAKTGRGPRVVLLSPACSSFDQFENYQSRGERFIEIVTEIAPKT